MNRDRPKLAIVLGIRPDVIRASLFLNLIRADPRVETTFIWSGQHYSDNLKDVFFRELGVTPPDIELGARGTNDAEVSSSDRHPAALSGAGRDCSRMRSASFSATPTP